MYNYLCIYFRLENAPVAVFIQEKLQGADILTYLSTKEHYSEQTIATVVTQVSSKSITNEVFNVCTLNFLGIRWITILALERLCPFRFTTR